MHSCEEESGAMRFLFAIADLTKAMALYLDDRMLLVYSRFEVYTCGRAQPRLHKNLISGLSSRSRDHFGLRS